MLLAGLVLAACSSGPNLSESERDLARTGVNLAASRTGIQLTPLDSDCVIEGMSDSQASQLVELGTDPDDSKQLTEELPVALADAIVDCVGADALVQSGLLVLTGELSETSTHCVGETFDHDLLSELIASGLAGEDRNASAIEIEVGLVLGVCLTPDELLLLHQS